MFSLDDVLGKIIGRVIHSPEDIQVLHIGHPEVGLDDPDEIRHDVEAEVLNDKHHADECSQQMGDGEEEHEPGAVVTAVMDRAHVTLQDEHLKRMDNSHRGDAQQSPDGMASTLAVVRIHTQVIHHKPQHPHHDKGIGQIAVTEVKRLLLPIEEKRQPHHQQHVNHYRQQPARNQGTTMICKRERSLPPKLVKQRL